MFLVHSHFGAQFDRAHPPDMCGLHEEPFFAAPQPPHQFDLNPLVKGRPRNGAFTKRWYQVFGVMSAPRASKRPARCLYLLQSLEGL